MAKKLLSLFSLLLSTCTLLYAQSIEDVISTRDLYAKNTNKYITVKGVELKPGLRMQDLLQVFESKGYTKSSSFEFAKSEFGIFDLSGSFYNRRDCKIRLIPIESDNRIVGKIGISFPERNSFRALKEEYDELKAALSAKYHINSCKELFDKDYLNSDTSDYLKLNALKKNECIFETVFYLSDDNISLLLGQIKLSITHIEVNYQSYYYVNLLYTTSDSVIEQLNNMNNDI